MLEVVDKGGELEYLYWSAWQVAAKAVVEEGSERVEIKLVNVSRNRRGRGLGSWLLDRVVEDFRHRKIVAWVFKPRVGWYRKRGFSKEERKNSIVKMVRAKG